jgi:hypothetical protein
MSAIIKYPGITEESQESVDSQLFRLSEKLQDLLPDPSLSPLERVERLGRVVPTSIQRSAQHLTARTKLNNIRLRLAELVPIEAMSAEEKIDILVEIIEELVPIKTDRLFERLELMGDNRLRDNGSVPFPGWDKSYLDLENLKTIVHNKMKSLVKNV